MKETPGGSSPRLRRTFLCVYGLGEIPHKSIDALTANFFSRHGMALMLLCSEHFFTGFLDPEAPAKDTFLDGQSLLGYLAAG